MKKTLSVVLSSVMAAALFLPSNATAAKYKEVEVTNGGTISGKITFTGKDPAPKTYTITKDTDTCGTGIREVDYVRVNNGALNNAVVYLKKVKKGKAWPKGVKDTKVNQKGCEFLPFLTVMANKGKLTAVNSDKVAHNIHTYELIGKVRKGKINVSQPKPGSITKKVKLRKGAGMKVECDQHDFMHSFVFVARNPYFAVVDQNGKYEIKDIPPGKYTVKTWHGTLKAKRKKKVEVTAGGAITVNFKYKK